VQVEDFSRDASRIFRPLQYERYVILKTVVVSGGIRTEGWVEEGDTQGKNKNIIFVSPYISRDYFSLCF
jgi:hypothetical protein